MSQIRTLESIVEPFVKRVGGELIRDLVGNDNPERSADYLFRRHNVIAELKSLQAGSFMEPFQRKLGDLMGKWDRTGRLRVYGTTGIKSKDLSPECQNEIFTVMAEPLQKHIVLEANNQIKSSKRLLDMPKAKGLLWVASDGNIDIQPNVAWYLLCKILQKKKESGDPAYSSIHALAYFSPRMLAKVPQAAEPAILWFSGCRQPDSELSECLKELSAGWPLYFSWAQGVKVREVNVSPEDARFLGVREKSPRITINYNQA